MKLLTTEYRKQNRTQLAINLSNVLINNTLSNKLKKIWQSLTISISDFKNILIKNRLIMKQNDCIPVSSSCLARIHLNHKLESAHISSVIITTFVALLCEHRSARRVQPRCSWTLYGRPAHDATAW